VHQIKPEQAYYNKSNIKAREDSDGALIIAYGDRQQTANPIDWPDLRSAIIYLLYDLALASSINRLDSSLVRKR